MPKKQPEPCSLCGTPGHDRSECENFEEGTRVLIDVGSVKAGSQGSLANVIGISVAGLSRARSKDSLDHSYREQLVRYIRGEPVTPVKRAWGRPSVAAEDQGEALPWVQGPQDLIEQFLELGDAHEHGRSGALTDALNDFIGKHDQRKLPAPPGRPLGSARVRCRVDAPIFDRFDKHVPRATRTAYMTLAIREWVDRHTKKKR